MIWIREITLKQAKLDYSFLVSERSNHKASEDKHPFCLHPLHQEKRIRCMLIQGKKKTPNQNQTNCIAFHNRRAQWGRHRTVTLEYDLRIAIASPQKITDAQTWVMSTTAPITWPGLQAKRDAWNMIVFTFLFCFVSPHKKKKLLNFHKHSSP